jgi:hypothetical protein
LQLAGRIGRREYDSHDRADRGARKNIKAAWQIEVCTIQKIERFR